MDIHLGDVNHTIQLAIAPVFLLTGIGTKLMVLTNRLARIIDRSRVLEERLTKNGGDRESSHDFEELATLYRRSHLINRAITLSTSSALMICLMIAALFIGSALDIGLTKSIAALFVLAMMALIGSFIFFLREILVATATMSIRRVPGIES